MGPLGLFAPEAGGDVVQTAVGLHAVEALVGVGIVEGTEVLEVGAQLDVVEVGGTYGAGQEGAAAVPAHAQGGVCLAHPQGEGFHFLGSAVAAHEADTGDVAVLGADEGVELCGGEFAPVVGPEVFAVAARAVAGTIGDVDAERDLVGYLAEHHSGVDVLHTAAGVKPVRALSPRGWRGCRSGVRPPPDVPARSCSRA